MSEVEIFVTKVEEGYMASKIKGYFLIRDQQIRFNALAFGRIGGHNINVKLAKKDEERIRKMGLDPEEIIITVQRKMVEGNITMENKRNTKLE